MEFLRRHVEKLVLGLVLVGLLTSVLLLLGAISNTRTVSTEMVDQARAAANGGLPVTLIPQEQFIEAYRIMADPAVRIEALGTGDPARPLRGSLYEPPDYIVCYNDACNRIIPMDDDICPFCGAEQPPKDQKDPGNDRDRDGLPNFVETKYEFLNPDNPYDARLDQDNDGFLNVEEFVAKTAMDDPASRPPLGLRLRFDRTLQKPLPVRLKRISLNNSEDPTAWSINLEYYDATKGRWRSKLSAIGKDLEGYKVTAARLEDDPENEGKQRGVVEVTPPEGGEPYVLTQGETAQERAVYAKMYFLVSRYYQYAQRGGVRTLIYKEGTNFTLQVGQDPDTVTEVYLLEKVTDTGAVILRIDPAPAEGEPPERITLPVLDMQKDFIPQDTGRTAGGAGGMMMGPGARGGR